MKNRLIIIVILAVISMGAARTSKSGEISLEACADDKILEQYTCTVDLSTISKARGAIKEFLTGDRTGEKRADDPELVIARQEREVQSEPETVEEVQAEALVTSMGPVVCGTERTPVESVVSTDSNAAGSGTGSIPLPDYLRSQLSACGADWFYPYAWAQCQQESGWNPSAVSPDGRDKGLLQYREQFWSQPESIFDPYAQIRLYVSQVTARINAGLSVEEVISRHYTSDYCPGICWEYVNQVLGWMR